MVLDVLPANLKLLEAVNGNLIYWDSPDTHCHDHGDSDLTLFTAGPRTVKLKPDYTYPTDYKPRIWVGSNNIPYDSRVDGREISFTIFAQINEAATVNIFVYETSSDQYHDLNNDPGSWFARWTTGFPHGVTPGPSWDYDYPDDTDIETIIEKENLIGTLTTFNLQKSPYTIDGKGFLTENKWQVLRTNWHSLPEVSLSRNLGILIEVIYENPGISSENAITYLTYPAIVSRYSFLRNYLGATAVYQSLPDVFRDNDSKQSNLDMPLARLIDVLTHFSDVVDGFIENWAYTDIMGGYDDADISTKSKLVNPDVAPLSSLLWLSQFVGVKRDAIKPTSTAWSGIPGTWDDLLAAADEDNDDVLTWEEVESYSPSFSKLVSYLRFAISSGFAGFRAGSQEAIVETVKFFLENNKVAWIDKNPTGTNRFSVTLYTYIGDTPDGTGVGGTSEIVQAAINISKPIGIDVEHVILADI